MDPSRSTPDPIPPDDRGGARSPLAAIFENTPNVAIQGYDAQGRVTYWNHASTHIYGVTAEQALGKRLGDMILTPQEEREFEKLLAGILATGKPAPMREWSITAGTGRRRHILSTLFPIHCGSDPTRVVCMDVDITQRKTAEEALRQSEERSRDLAQRLRGLLMELDHRVKNNLASLHALVDMYARSASSVEAFAQAMRGKLMAMRAAHELAAAEAGRPVPLTDLLHSLIRQHEPPGRGGSSVGFEGPPLRIAPRQVGPMAMIFQELFANASKYGALRSAEGKVAIRWAVLDGTRQGCRVRVIWSERSDRPVAPPGSGGVGLHLIESFARFELGGRAAFSVEPDGFTCEVECVLDPDHNHGLADEQGGPR